MNTNNFSYSSVSYTLYFSDYYTTIIIPCNIKERSLNIKQLISYTDKYIRLIDNKNYFECYNDFFRLQKNIIDVKKCDDNGISEVYLEPHEKYKIFHYIKSAYATLKCILIIKRIYHVYNQNYYQQNNNLLKNNKKMLYLDFNMIDIKRYPPIVNTVLGDKINTIPLNNKILNRILKKRKRNELFIQKQRIDYNYKKEKETVKFLKKIKIYP